MWPSLFAFKTAFALGKPAHSFSGSFAGFLQTSLRCCCGSSRFSLFVNVHWHFLLQQKNILCWWKYQWTKTFAQYCIYTQTYSMCIHTILLNNNITCYNHVLLQVWKWICDSGTLECSRTQRLYRACLQRREGLPMSSLPVVALMTSRAWSPTVQFTLKLGAFPGCRASALLIPANAQTHRS